MIKATNQVGFEVQIYIPKSGWQFYVSPESQIFSNIGSSMQFMKTLPQYSGYEFRVYPSLKEEDDK